MILTVAELFSQVDWNLVFAGLVSVDELVAAFMNIIDSGETFDKVHIKSTEHMKKPMLPKQIIKMVHQKCMFWQIIILNRTP